MHAVIAFSSVPLFLGALLSDWAYARSEQVQWTNFASWLIAGGLVVAGIALVWAAADVLSAAARRGRLGLAYLGLLFAGVLLGVVNALVHARDGWAAMPGGLVLSVVVLVAVVSAGVMGLAGLTRRAP